MIRPLALLALTAALLLVGAGSAQSEFALRLNAAARRAHPAVRLAEEAKDPANGARYTLLATTTPPTTFTTVIRALLQREYRDGTEPFEHFVVIYAGGSYTAVPAKRDSAGGALSVGSPIAWTPRAGLEHEYGETRLLSSAPPRSETVSPPRPPTASTPRPATSARPRGTPNSSSYTSNERSSTFVMFGPNGLATYRQVCTYSTVGGTFRSNCVETTW
jgi:hypothetical protein